MGEGEGNFCNIGNLLLKNSLCLGKGILLKYPSPHLPIPQISLRALCSSAPLRLKDAICEGYHLKFREEL
jgi:hypothetical protein